MGRKSRIADAQAAELTRFKPRTPEQQRFVKSIWNNPITVVIGPAGTGKTGLSIQTGIDMLKGGHVNKIIVIRLISDTCDEHLGALPGEMDEKLYQFAGPILDNLEQILPFGEIEYFFNKRQIEVLPVSRARGRSFTNTYVMVEEAQNLDWNMTLTLLTRVGEGTRLVINGDPNQIDIRGRNGTYHACRLLEGVEGAEIIEFEECDVQRSYIVKAILERARLLQDSALSIITGGRA